MAWSEVIASRPYLSPRGRDIFHVRSRSTDGVACAERQEVEVDSSRSTFPIATVCDSKCSESGASLKPGAQVFTVDGCRELASDEGISSTDRIHDADVEARLMQLRFSSEPARTCRSAFHDYFRHRTQKFSHLRVKVDRWSR